MAVELILILRLSFAEVHSVLFVDVYIRRRDLSMPPKLSTPENYHPEVRKPDLVFFHIYFRIEAFIMNLLSKGEVLKLKIVFNFLNELAANFIWNLFGILYLEERRNKFVRKRLIFYGFFLYCCGKVTLSHLLNSYVSLIFKDVKNISNEE